MLHLRGCKEGADEKRAHLPLLQSRESNSEQDVVTSVLEYWQRAASEVTNSGDPEAAQAALTTFFAIDPSAS